MEFKAADVRKNLKCATTEVNGASCLNCCKNRDICHNMAVACGADKVKDAAKMSVATTSTTKVDDCCSAEAKCDTHTCGTGWEADTTKATVKCGATTCSNMLCCKLKKETCEGQQTAGNKCKNADDAITTHEYDSTKAATPLGLAQAGMFTDTCCKKKQTCAGLETACGADQVHDMAAANTATTAADYKTTCCKTALKCGTDFSCAGVPGWIKDATKDTVICPKTGEDLARKQECDAATCCKPDPKKCRGYVATCPADQEKSDRADKADTAVATADEFKKSCCVAKKTCDEAFDFVIVTKGTASGSSHQHEPVMVLLFAAMGALALRM